MTCVGHTQLRPYTYGFIFNLTTANEIHEDDNKAPAEIVVTTLGHPDDRGSPCVTIQGPGDLKSSVSVFIFDAFI